MNRAFRFLIFGIVLCAAVTAARAQETKVADWTIDLYYKALNAKYLPIADKFKDKNKLVKEVDYQNKYIILGNDEWKGWGEVVLFDKKGGGHLLAVTQYDCTRKYAQPYSYYGYATCAGVVNFLEYDGKKWIERSDLMPDLPKLRLYAQYEKKTGKLADGEHKLIFELPRERKDILIKLSGEAVYSLDWNGEKFVGSYVN